MNQPRRFGDIYWPNVRNADEHRARIDLTHLVPDTRLVHVKIIEGKFITVFPPAGRSRHTISARRSEPKDRNERIPPRTNPTLLICKRMIEAAVHDAQETVNGAPTEEATIARAWLAHDVGKPDLQLYSGNPVYKEAYLEAYYCSFGWCCSWLGYSDRDAEQYRKQLLGKVDRALAFKWEQDHEPASNVLDEMEQAGVRNVSQSLIRQINRGETWWRADPMA